MTATKFWIPGGGDVAATREAIRLPPEYMRMLAAFADTASQIDLGLHCSRCHENLTGKNARADTQWTMACACRTFIGANPLPPGQG